MTITKGGFGIDTKIAMQKSTIVPPWNMVVGSAVVGLFLESLFGYMNSYEIKSTA